MSVRYSHILNIFKTHFNMKQLIKLFKPDPVKELIEQVNKELELKEAKKGLQKEDNEVPAKEAHSFELYGSDADLGYC